VDPETGEKGADLVHVVELELAQIVLGRAWQIMLATPSSIFYTLVSRLNCSL
jgi:hypothetical protein